MRGRVTGPLLRSETVRLDMLSSSSSAAPAPAPAADSVDCEWFGCAAAMLDDEKVAILRARPEAYIYILALAGLCFLSLLRPASVSSRNLAWQ